MEVFIMLMANFMKTRKSIRDFKNKKIKSGDVKKLNSIISEVNSLAKLYSVDFHLEENGAEVVEVLKGKGGYAGTMILAPAYIAMDIENEVPEAYIYGAYYMEDLITKLQDIGLGSCWISLHNADEESMQKAFPDKTGKIEFALGIGYPYANLNIGEEKYSSRLGLEDFIYDGDFNTPIRIETLESYGLDDLFYYLRYAPSSKNLQPWRFLITDSEVELYIENFDGHENYVDAGIVMYYYTKLAEASGIRAKWNLDEKPDAGNKKYIGTVNF